MARSVYVEVRKGEESGVINAAAAHADAYAVTQMVDVEGGKTGILFTSAGAANPEATSVKFTNATGELPAE